jgi:chemotaxis protein MotB
MRPIHFHAILFLSAAATLSFAGCVSTGKFNAMQQQAQKNDSLYTWSMRTLKACQDDNNKLVRQKAALQDQANDLNVQMTATKENITLMRKQLQNLSALSSAQAESIKKSLDNMGAKDDFIQELRSTVAHRNSENMAILLNLKAALGSFGNQDVAIKIEKSVVCLDLSDTLLFTSDSNSSTLTDKARSLLGRLARVLHDQPEIECTVEGHPANIPKLTAIVPNPADSSLHLTDSTSKTADSTSHATDSTMHPADSTSTLLAALTGNAALTDNWELPVQRATAIVRVLQHNYTISSERLTVAGRTDNRRTRIILLTPMDKVLEVLERK